MLRHGRPTLGIKFTPEAGALASCPMVCRSFLGLEVSSFGSGSRSSWAVSFSLGEPSLAEVGRSSPLKGLREWWSFPSGRAPLSLILRCRAAQRLSTHGCFCLSCSLALQRVPHSLQWYFAHTWRQAWLVSGTTLLSWALAWSCVLEPRVCK